MSTTIGEAIHEAEERLKDLGEIYRTCKNARLSMLPDGRTCFIADDITPTGVFVVVAKNTDHRRAKECCGVVEDYASYLCAYIVVGGTKVFAAGALRTDTRTVLHDMSANNNASFLKLIAVAARPR